MKNIFIGFILIFLNFNLVIGQSKIGLIPDFLGYIVMIKGLVEMAEETTLFIEIKPYATGMAVYTAFLYVMDLLGVSLTYGMLSFFLAFISTCISLTISYNIVMGVLDMERRYDKLLNGSALKSTWNVLMIFNILVYISLFTGILATLCIIVTFIVHIFFLLDFYKSKNMYYDAITKPF